MESQKCKRCGKWFNFKEDDKFSEVCPKCKKYFEKHPREYCLLDGEYCQCKNCGNIEYYTFFVNSFLCVDCWEKFQEQPKLEEEFNSKQRRLKLRTKITSTLRNILDRMLFYVVMALLIAFCLFVVYLWICGLIENATNFDDLYEPRMKPDF
jgi:hypothetical protein